MKLWLCLSLVVCIHFVAAETSTASTNSSSTTSVSPTTASSVSTTTRAPTEHTKTTSHTTHATSSSTTSSSTEATTPSTAAPTTTSPEPTTVAPAGVPKYEVREGENICLLLQSYIAINVPYFTKTEQTSKVVKLEESTRKNVSGTCGKVNETIEFIWNPGTPHDWNLTMTFSKSAPTPTTESTMFMSFVKLEYELSPNIFPGTNSTGQHWVNSTENYFETPSGSFYECLTQQTVSLLESTQQDPKNVPVIGLSFSEMKLEVFRNSSNSNFTRHAYQCSSGSASDNIIPIAVGCALAAMILIALIVFLVGNRRRQLGYQAI